MKLLFSCEHAENKIPFFLKDKINISRKVLNSHRGYDIGIKELSLLVSNSLEMNIFSGEFSRLVIDLNRSLRHPKLFSEFTSDLAKEEKNQIIEKIYNPYRNLITSEINKYIKKNKKVFHISWHSFTPLLGTVERKTAFGILYDPKLKSEKNLAIRLKNEIQKETSLPVRMNYPYRGNADGFTTYLRGYFCEDLYSGLEIEVNQSLLYKKENIKEIARILKTAIINLKKNNI